MSRSIRSSAVVGSGVGIGLFFSSTLMAQMPAPVGSVTLPVPDANAYSTSFRYDSTGTLYAWDGYSVLKEAPLATSFTSIGHVKSGNSADPGPINFSQDGTQVLVGNGAGGQLGGAYSGLLFDLPKAGGNVNTSAGSIQYQDDFIPVPAIPATATIPSSATKYFVDQANDALGDSSSVSVFDSSNGSNRSIITNIPGASASVAFNPLTNSLYAEIGYGADSGQIRSFSLSALATAFNTNTPIDFSSGTLFNYVEGTQSGAGLFFDADGYLFSGGGDGLDVFNPAGKLIYDQDPTGSTYSSIAYNPASDQVLEVVYGDSGGSVYNAASFETFVPEPTSAALLAIGSIVALGRRRTRHSNVGA